MRASLKLRLLRFFAESSYSSPPMFSCLLWVSVHRATWLWQGEDLAFVSELFLLFLICGRPSVPTHMFLSSMTVALWFRWHHLFQDAGTAQHTQLSMVDSTEHMLHVTPLSGSLFMFLICFLDSYTGCLWLRQPKIFWALSPYFKTPQKAIHKAATSGDSHLWKSIGFCPSDSSFGCRESWLPACLTELSKWGEDGGLWWHIISNATWAKSLGEHCCPFSPGTPSQWISSPELNSELVTTFTALQLEF